MGGKAAVLTCVTARRDGRIHLKKCKEETGKERGSDNRISKNTSKKQTNKTQTKTHLGEALICKLFTSYLQSNTWTLELVV